MLSFDFSFTSLCFCLRDFPLVSQMASAVYLGKIVLSLALESCSCMFVLDEFALCLSFCI